MKNALKFRFGKKRKALAAYACQKAQDSAGKAPEYPVETERGVSRPSIRTLSNIPLRGGSYEKIPSTFINRQDSIRRGYRGRSCCQILGKPMIVQSRRADPVI
jgi:hypothetical protein